MPKLTLLRYGQPTTVVLTFDEKGGHPWRSTVVGEAAPEDSIKVIYDPGFNTTEYRRQLAETYKADNPQSPAIFEFLACVKEWDVLDEKGHKFVLTEEGLKDVPINLIHAVVNGCNEDISLPKSGTPTN